jgi:peptidyl-tRNA hydrolase, PTH1 family
MSKFLIAGLGNPGSEYEATRHNVGFRIANEIVSAAGGKFVAGRYADVAEVKYKGRTMVVIKPTTFMNLSGKAVNYWLQAEKIEPARMMVLVDEIALPFGKIRVGPKGSDGGHNGLASVQETIGTTEYPRLRFGIGNNYGKGQQVDYVLGSWGEEELKTLPERIRLAADAVRTFVFAGLQHSMNGFNNK